MYDTCKMFNFPIYYILHINKLKYVKLNTDTKNIV